MLIFVIYYFSVSYYFDDPILCQPVDGGELPCVNYATKPVLVSNETPGLVPELPSTPVQRNNCEGLAELPSTPVQRNNCERLAELPSTHLHLNNSSVVTENNSVSSNIHELGTANSVMTDSVTTNSITSSRVAVVGSVSSNIQELDVNNSVPSNISQIAENNSVSSNIHELGIENSIRSSLIANHGSTTPTTIGESNYVGFQGEIGYLAPDYALVPTPCDPTENVRKGTFKSVIASLNH